MSDRSNYVNVRLSVSGKKFVADKARDRNITLSDVVRVALERASSDPGFDARLDQIKQRF